MYIYKHRCTCKCMCMYICVCVQQILTFALSQHRNTRARPHTHTHACTHALARARAHTHTHTHTHNLHIAALNGRARPLIVIPILGSEAFFFFTTQPQKFSKVSALEHLQHCCKERPVLQLLYWIYYVCLTFRSQYYLLLYQVISVAHLLCTG